MTPAPRPTPPGARRVLVAIAEHTDRAGIPPTLRAIGAALGIRSMNGVNDHLVALERRGLISRRSNEARGILITAAGRAELGEDRATRLMRAFCVEYGQPWPPNERIAERLRVAVTRAMAEVER